MKEALHQDPFNIWHGNCSECGQKIDEKIKRRHVAKALRRQGLPSLAKLLTMTDIK